MIFKVLQLTSVMSLTLNGIAYANDALPLATLWINMFFKKPPFPTWSAMGVFVLTLAKLKCTTPSTLAKKKAKLLADIVTVDFRLPKQTHP